MQNACFVDQQKETLSKIIKFCRRSLLSLMIIAFGPTQRYHHTKSIGIIESLSDNTIQLLKSLTVFIYEIYLSRFYCVQHELCGIPSLSNH